MKSEKKELEDTYRKMQEDKDTGEEGKYNNEGKKNEITT